ncbi:MAG: iron-containing alcohol dehydrogenase, partial [Bacteroidota bacterium]
MVQFNFPTIIRFGAGAVTELAGYLKSKDIKHPLFVTDTIIATLDFTHTLIRDVKQKGISIAVFHDIHKNPVKSDVLKGRDAFDSNKCDAIIGLGGGAAIDVARAIV